MGRSEHPHHPSREGHVSTKAKPKRRAKPKSSTALVARRKVPLVRRLPLPERIEALPVGVSAALLSDPVMTASFVGTLHLAEPQILALRRPVEDREVEWRPAVKDGPPVIPYLAHNGYRDRLDAAFGLGGWGMIPVGMPKEKDGVVYTPYALVIDVSRAFMRGGNVLTMRTTNR